MQICGYGLSDISDIAHKVLVHLNGLKEHKRPERKGLYLAIFKRSTGELLALMKVGEFDDLKFGRSCFQVVQTKIQMLLMHPGIITTFADGVRNRELGFYGGGIAIPKHDLAIAASGSDEHGDDAFCIALGSQIRALQPDDIGLYNAISISPLVTPLLDSLAA